MRAIHTIAAHPTNADVLYVGTPNGGIWKTTNATSANPHWTPLTDSQVSLSISTLEFDPTDPTGNTLLAGIGRYSSFGFLGGARTGLLRTTNGGVTWTPIDGGTLRGSNISGVAIRGSRIVVSVNVDEFSTSDAGIYVSTNGGTSFGQGSVTFGGVPRGTAFDLVGDPSNTAILYTAIARPDAGSDGIYRSMDTGNTWTLVSNSTMNGLIDNTTNNIEIAVGNAGNVYVGVINSGQLARLCWRRALRGGCRFRIWPPGRRWLGCLPSRARTGWRCCPMVGSTAPPERCGI